MPRNPRYVPPNSLQHVSDIVAQNRFLLTPSPLLNERFVGILGKAQETFAMPICAAVVLSSHYHLLLRPRDGKHLADFMCFLKTNLAKEIGRRLQGWTSHFFDRRYHTITVSDEEKAQVEVLRYVLSHGVKELLVDTVREWPGIHCAVPLIEGVQLTGRWYDRSSEYAERRRRKPKEVDEEDFASQQAVTFSPLPCWQHLPEPTWRQYVVEMVKDIDHQGAIERKIQGRSSLGAAKILKQDPQSRPDEVIKSSQPLFHTASKEAFQAMLEIWREVVRTYRLASKRLRSGDRDAVFPEGTFPPSLPYRPFETSMIENIGVLGARGQPA